MDADEERPPATPKGGRWREELTREGGVPDGAHKAFRKWSRKVWESRGGGAYALGFIVMFLYLEIKDILFDDIPTLMNMNVFSSDIVSFAISFIIDTMLNTLYALIWPVWLLQWNGIVGVILLVAIYALYPKFIQQPVEHWLFEGQPPPPPKKQRGRKKSG